MKIPPKPKRGKRSPFYWWRRWKSHKYLPTKKGLLARILNGDFEYPINLNGQSMKHTICRMN